MESESAPPGGGRGLLALWLSLGAVVAAYAPAAGLSLAQRHPTATLGEGLAQAAPWLAIQCVAWALVPMLGTAAIVTALLAWRTDERLYARAALLVVLGLLISWVFLLKPMPSKPPKKAGPTAAECEMRAKAGEPCVEETALDPEPPPIREYEPKSEPHKGPLKPYAPKP